MKWMRIAVPVLTLLAGMVIGYAGRNVTAKGNGTTTFVERREGGYRYVNPLLDCDIAGNVLKNRELRPFRDEVAGVVDSWKNRGGVTDVSVYFRELNDGLWFSIGDADRFTPASLRKVPLMIALLKQSERDKGLLDRVVKLALARDYNADQNIKPSRTMVPGRGYTVRDLIVRMIVYSDNNAFTLLATIVDNAELDNVYALLRMQNPQVKQDDAFLSVQTYASFFRVLYNATYLTKEASGWALEVLSQSEFRDGIVAGVPRPVPVSHKFGEHSDADGSVQLHDCGIVYYPRHPYLLCVMSRGTAFENLDDVIAAVSRSVFAEIDAQHRAH